MTNSDLNSKIAKKMGWTNLSKNSYGLVEGRAPIDNHFGHLPIPNYTDSFDACYEAAKKRGIILHGLSEAGCSKKGSTFCCVLLRGNEAIYAEDVTPSKVFAVALLRALQKS